MQGNEWKLGLDPEQLSKLKDEYKQDRKKKAQQSKRKVLAVLDCVVWQ